MTEIEKAYAAGLIDGEGTVTLTRRDRKAKYRWPVVSVTSTTLEIIEQLAKFGGSVHKRSRRIKHHKDVWVWSIRGQKALAFLRMVRPYMVEPSKVTRADMLINDYDAVTHPAGKYTPEMRKNKLAFEAAFMSS